MREARMDVNEDMVSVPGWILKPPTVLFNRPGDNQQAFAAYGHDPMTHVCFYHQADHIVI